MKKMLLFLFVLVAFGVQAQTVSIEANPSSSANIVFGTLNSHASEHYYTAVELGNNFLTAAKPINVIGVKVGTVGTNTTFPNVKIYLKETTTTTTVDGPYSLTGYTLVYSGSVTLAKTGFSDIILATPFVRTSASSGLAMLFTRDSGVTHPSFLWASANGNNTDPNLLTSRRYNGPKSPVPGTTTLTASAFRAAVRFKYSADNDAAVDEISITGKLPAFSVITADTVKARITNNGLNPLTNVPVTLNVTGANPFTNQQIIPSLLPGASTVVTFNTIVPVNYGTNHITVSVPSDDDNGNNSKTQDQQVVSDAIRLADNSVVSNQIGYNTGSGLLLVRYRLNENAFITAVKTSLGVGAVGNTVYGVVLNSSGTILAQSTPYTVQASDVDTYVTFSFPTPVTVPLGTDFYIGLAQTTGATGYFPLNAQAETITRYNTYFGAMLTGGTFTEYPTLGRFMIEAQFNSLLPVKYSIFNGEKTSTGNRLFWTTSFEQNNKGFNIERSSNGVDFVKIGYVASLAENGNSNANLQYSFVDATPEKGNNYYRLNQVDKDGKTAYSNTIVITSTTEQLEIVNVFPNPTSKTLRVKLAVKASDAVQLAITDAYGKTVAQSVHNLQSGENLVDIDVAHFAAGTYFITVNGKAGVFTTQFTKK